MKQDRKAEFVAKQKAASRAARKGRSAHSANQRLKTGKAKVTLAGAITTDTKG